MRFLRRYTQMIQKYKFEGENDFIEFDDSKSVKELINYAFDKFDYFEPAGIELVTLFQCHHPNSSTGWFTTDTSKKCSEVNIAVSLNTCAV